MSSYKNQHVIPQVYLKLFGFEKLINEKPVWVVSVKNLEKNKWEDRVIKKFLSENHKYTIEEYDATHRLILERDLNGGIERRLPIIIEQIENNEISANIHMAIAETVANFLARTNTLIGWLQHWLRNREIQNLVNYVLKVNNPTEEECKVVNEEISNMVEKDAVNYLMLLYMNYVGKLLNICSIEILVGSDELLFFTSDNPVAINRDFGFGEIEKEEAEIFFPISSKILIRFYWHPKDQELNRNLRKITKKEYDRYHNEIMIKSAHRFIISPVDKSLIGK